MFLQIGSSFVLDQVPGIFLFWVLLDLADEIVVTFTTLEIRTVEGNAVYRMHSALQRCGPRAWSLKDRPSRFSLVAVIPVRVASSL